MCPEICNADNATCWGPVNKWLDGRAPPELLNTRCEFQRTVKCMASFVHLRGAINGM